jgi:lipoyl(octanoyl) transferase
MSRRAPTKPPFATQLHWLGVVDYEDCLTAQKRLAYDAATRGDGRMTILVCEHPGLITIGRRGSRDQLQLTGAELSERALTVRYVARGGGCMLHAPGQAAIYVVTQLAWHDWSVGEFVRRLENGLRGTLEQLAVQTMSLPNHFGLWGKTGQLAALGVAVKFGVTTQGAVLNLDPELGSLRRIEALSVAEYRELSGRMDSSLQPAKAGTPTLPQRPVYSSLLSETGLPVKMTAVREALVAQLPAAFGCDQVQVHTGHPLIPEIPGSATRESAA